MPGLSFVKNWFRTGPKMKFKYIFAFMTQVLKKFWFSPKHLDLFKTILMYRPVFLWSVPIFFGSYKKIGYFKKCWLIQNHFVLHMNLKTDTISRFRPLSYVRNSLVPISCWYYLTFTDMIRWILIVFDLFSLK